MSDVRIRAVKNGYIITSDFVTGTYIATSLQEAMDQAKEIFETAPMDEEQKPTPYNWPPLPLQNLFGDHV